jgi:hypothetical protein
MALAKKAKKAKKAKPVKSVGKANPFIQFQPTDPSPPIPITFFRKPSPFNITPTGYFHPLLQMYLDNLPTQISARHIYVERHFPLNSPFAGMSQPVSLFPNADPITPSWSKQKSVAMRKSIFRIMRLRFTFRRLLHKWRFSKLNTANTDDIVTAEPPKKPVMIVAWIQKQIYTFEAQTLMKDITARLLHHDGLFEDPQAPRNPFTNIPLTQTQIISVWNSISNSAIPVSTVFTLFRSARYNIKVFIEENQTFLKLNSLRKTFQEASSYDYRERMIDFIKYSYDIETLDCDYIAFSYAIEKYPNYRTILKWKELCLRYYEADIIYVSNPLKMNEVKNKALDDSCEILHLQTQVISLYNRSI